MQVHEAYRPTVSFFWNTSCAQLGQQALTFADPFFLLLHLSRTSFFLDCPWTIPILALPLGYAHPDLQSERGFLIECLALNPNALHFVPATMRMDVAFQAAAKSHVTETALPSPAWWGWKRALRFSHDRIWGNGDYIWWLYMTTISFRIWKVWRGLLVQMSAHPWMEKDVCWGITVSPESLTNCGKWRSFMKIVDFKDSTNPLPLITYYRVVFCIRVSKLSYFEVFWALVLKCVQFFALYSLWKAI